jgi:hypothetical protein
VQSSPESFATVQEAEAAGRIEMENSSLNVGLAADLSRENETRPAQIAFAASSIPAYPDPASVNWLF